MPKWYVGPNGEGRWADPNNDGIIDSADFGMLQNCYTAITSRRPECGPLDVDSSGQVTAVDFSMLATIMGNGWDPRSQTQLRSADAVPPPAEHTLTLSHTAIGVTRVTFATLHGVAIPVSANGRYPTGARVAIVAEPAAGYKFSRWLDAGKGVTSGPTILTDLDADKSLTAEFVLLAPAQTPWGLIILGVVLVAAFSRER